MSIFEYDQERHMRMLQEEGIEKGETLALIRIVTKMKHNSMTAEEIASILEEDIKKIRKIETSARELKSEDPEKIYASLQEGLTSLTASSN